MGAFLYTVLTCRPLFQNLGMLLSQMNVRTFNF